MAARYVIRVLAASAAAALSLAPLQAASAQNIFQSLFGGFHWRAPVGLPVNSRAFVDPFTALSRAADAPPPTRYLPSGRDERSPGTASCVRTCDGFYFVVHSNAGASAAQMCHAFCPGSETKLYSGSNIDFATTSDGSRYADLDTAYLYRKHLVAGCTCNGRDAFGLAHIDVNNDPTLKPGDVVATKGGLMAFTGARDKVANFTPVEAYGGFSKSYRDALAELKIAPPYLQPPDAVAASVPAATAENGESRSAAN
jgi:Protein of unknown function (DUF2865)